MAGRAHAHTALDNLCVQRLRRPGYVAWPRDVGNQIKLLDPQTLSKIHQLPGIHVQEELHRLKHRHQDVNVLGLVVKSGPGDDRFLIKIDTPLFALSLRAPFSNHGVPFFQLLAIVVGHLLDINLLFADVGLVGELPLTCDPARGRYAVVCLNAFLARLWNSD